MRDCPLGERLRARVIAPAPAARRIPTSRAPADGTRAELRVLESTDIHSNMMSYDYYRLADDSTSASSAWRRSSRTRARNSRTRCCSMPATRSRAPRSPIIRRSSSRRRATRNSRSTARWMRSITTAARSAITNSTMACRFWRSTDVAMDVDGIDAKALQGTVVSARARQRVQRDDDKPIYAPWRVNTRHHGQDGRRPRAKRRSASASSASRRRRSCSGTSAISKARSR